jgi:hypothetical protein
MERLLSLSSFYPNLKAHQTVMEILTRIYMSVYVTIHLFLEIHAHRGRWKYSFLSFLFIQISKQT